MHRPLYGTDIAASSGSMTWQQSLSGAEIANNLKLVS
jgi:hypothetical protein